MDLTEIVGGPQSGKTSKAIEMITEFIGVEGRKVVWIDADLKFPRDLRSPNIYVKECRFEEDVLLSLLYIYEKSVEYLPDAIVIDSFNNFYWIGQRMKDNYTSLRINELVLCLSRLTKVVLVIQDINAPIHFDGAKVYR